MPRFEPFRGLRYDLSRVAIGDVTAPPYDVIDGSDRERLLAVHGDNIVAVDLPNPAETDGDEPYEAAAATMSAWLADGLLVEDPPSFYGYRMSYRTREGTERRTTGVIGALELSRPGEGGILPHEETTPKAKSDRLQLLRATHTNLSAVWGLSPASGLTELVEPTERDQVVRWVDPDGVTHEYWLLDAERQEAVTSLVAAHPVVIADGHHRYETSLAYRDERRAHEGGTAGEAESIMTWVVELRDDQLHVAPIHRVLSGMDHGFDFREAFAPFFEISPAGSLDGVEDRMRGLGCLVLVDRSGAWYCTPRPNAFAGVRDLDSSRLDAARHRLPGHEIAYHHDIDTVASQVRTGRAQAGVLLRPATVGQILEIADGGDRMPPKTTFFYPKPRTGVVVRRVNG